MVARIYDKKHISLSTYLDFKDKTIQEVKEWFSKNFKGYLKGVAYIYSLLDDKTYRWGDLKEIEIND